MLFYFAGHGIAEDGTNGPTGSFVPQDAGADHKTFLPMQDVHKALEALDCQHVFAILDCCFAGSFEWAESTRELTQTRPLTQESYDHYQQTPAWQVLTSTT